MVAKKVYRLIKSEPEIELIDDNSKFLKISLISLAGIGVGIGAALIYRNIKLKRQAEHEYYMERLEEYIEGQKEFERQEATKKKLQDDLEEKVEEFNNRRVSYDNEQHSSKEDIEKYSENEIDSDKAKSKTQTYQEEHYDKNEIYDEDLKNQK